MTEEELLELAEQAGFSHFGKLNMSELRTVPEVREMCAAGKCQCYGRNWACPPHCGTLQELEAKMRACRCGVLLQSTAQLEDDFDIETMEDTQRLHKERFSCMVQQLLDRNIACFPMGAGSCTICGQGNCTCPDEPCRFPERAHSSMEACGLLVSQICSSSGLDYYYGPHTLTYTSCVLI